MPSEWRNLDQNAFMRRIIFGMVFCFVLNCAFAQGVEPEIFAPGVVSGPVNDAAPSFSPDGETVYFHRSGPSMTGSILVSHRQSGVWSAPVFAAFSGRWQDIEPAMAPDGSYLIFSSNRPVGAGGKVLNGTWNSQHFAGGGGNLWRVDRVGRGWGEPKRLPDVINSDSSVFSPAVTADGSLYFMKPVRDTGHFHLYRSQYRAGQYERPVEVSFHAADSVSDVDPAVAADESFLVFSSRRAGLMELFIVLRKDGVWGQPQALGPAVHRGMYCIEAKLSADGKRLYFGSAYTHKPADPGDVLKRSEWETGLLNIWSVALGQWVEK
jgi:Tol biopolymer transport system component